METPQPLEQHHWLLQLLGDWAYDHECNMGPDQPPMKCSGTQTTRALGQLWILTEITGAMPNGDEARSVITLGYDPAQERFVGTFVSSCMTHMWPYRGMLDAARKVLTLDSEGPSFSGDGTMAKYQDIIEIVDRDHHTMTSQLLGPDGQWVRFMHGTYRRTGAAK
ncbi:MAG: DUF1579 domain-containing protein [Planctomycetaceae bacterium]